MKKGEVVLFAGVFYILVGILIGLNVADLQPDAPSIYNVSAVEPPPARGAPPRGVDRIEGVDSIEIMICRSQCMETIVCRNETTSSSEFSISFSVAADDDEVVCIPDASGVPVCNILVDLSSVPGPCITEVNSTDIYYRGCLDRCMIQ